MNQSGHYVEKRADKRMWAPLCQGALEAAAIERRDLERRQIDAVQAAHVDGNHVRAVRHLAAGERFDSAAGTEQVMDHLPVELVIRHVVLAKTQGDLVRPQERPQDAALAAGRAVARDRSGAT